MTETAVPQNSEGRSREAVVLVHGLWMTGVDMLLLRKRLGDCGYRVYQFSYPTVQVNLAANARTLAAFVRAIPEQTIHLVGHSLGGLVIRCLLDQFTDLKPGRVVTLATPHNGSHTAHRVARSGWLRRILGASLPALVGSVPPWNGQREMGSLAGRLGIGIGWFFRDLPRPNDGTVAVVETELAGMSDHRVLGVSHMGMLVAPSAAHQVCYFLQHGRFDHDD